MNYICNEKKGIKMDTGGRVLVKSNLEFGSHNYKKNWCKVTFNKNGAWITVNKVKYNLNELTNKELYVWDWETKYNKETKETEIISKACADCYTIDL